MANEEFHPISNRLGFECAAKGMAGPRQPAIRLSGITTKLDKSEFASLEYRLQPDASRGLAVSGLAQVIKQGQQTNFVLHWHVMTIALKPKYVANSNNDRLFLQIVRYRTLGETRSVARNGSRRGGFALRGRRASLSNPRRVSWQIKVDRTSST